MDVTSFQREIEDYKKKIQQLRERQRIEAAKAKREEARKKKKEEDRKKLLLGVGILEAIRHGRITEEKVFDLINQSISRPQDRDFLGLPVAQKTVRPAEVAHNHQQEGVSQ